MTDAELKGLYDGIVHGRRKDVVAITQKAIAEGVDAKKIVDNYLVPAMDEVGRLFEANEYFVPELLIAARAMKASLELLRPLLLAAGSEPAGRVAIGTVKGDLHDIGKNLVAVMLEGGGFEVVDLGVDVSPEKFVATATEKHCQIICLSALLTTTMPMMEDTVKALKDAGMYGKIKVMIGGAPVTQAYADQIGADGYSDNAAGAVSKARELVGKA